MNTVSNIVVPIDFSDESKTALRLAFEWSDLLKCSVILLHTYRLIADDETKETDSPRKIRESIVSRKMEKFEQIKKEIDFSKAYSYSFILEPGFPHDSVVRYTRENDIDLAIIGTDAALSLDDRKGFEYIINHTAVPVLIVDKDYPFKAKVKEPSSYDILSMENSVFINNIDRQLDKTSKNPGRTYLVYPSPDHEKQFTGKLLSIADGIINFNKEK